MYLYHSYSLQNIYNSVSWEWKHYMLTNHNIKIQHLLTIFYFLSKPKTWEVWIAGKKLNAYITILKQSLNPTVTWMIPICKMIMTTNFNFQEPFSCTPGSVLWELLSPSSSFPRLGENLLKKFKISLTKKLGRPQTRLHKKHR